jgi:hypothetical protein
MNSFDINTLKNESSLSLVDSSVAEFKVYARKTAENILEMGRVVCETKSKSKKNPKDFESFCERIGFEPKSSYIKKLVLIGKSYLSLKAQAQYLPNNWTTLYQIARLTNQQLAEFIKQGLIHQNVIGSQIEALLKPQPNNPVEEKISTETKTEVPFGTFLNGLCFVCDVGQLNDLSRKSSIESIIDSLKALNVRVDISPDLIEAIKPPMALAA